MPRAQCYYEILGIEETATGDEVKKAYRNLALVWHPDKNQANQEEAHRKFQIILKAYETLSDSRERDWYDRHRDQILSDGKSEAESCINLFQYFSSACYANYDDSEDGFYTIYRQVFDTIAKEEEQAQQQASKSSKNKQSKCDTSLPSFGDSKSDYETVVRKFYAYWSGFYTSLTFDHLDKYNTTEAENRRILRAMEKENKKLKEVAKKERNTNVRNLVEFIKKRDRRLKAHKLIVDQQIQANRQKTAEKQRQQREKLLKESSNYKPTAWEDMNNIEEQLRQLENEYEEFDDKKRRRNRRPINDSSDDDADDFRGDVDDDDCDQGEDRFQSTLDKTDPELKAQSAADGEENDDETARDDDQDEENEEEEEDEEEEMLDFYCPACNKEFRSMNAFENHEASKKHKQNVAKLTKLLKEDEKRGLNKCK